jgi:hypothetical protein
MLSWIIYYRGYLSEEAFFFGCLIAFFALWSSYPIAAVLHFGYTKSVQELLKNDPSYILVGSFVLPVAFSLFLASLDLQLLQRLLHSHRWIVLGTLLFLVTLAIYMAVVQAPRKSIVQPIYFREAVQLLEEEAKIRSQIHLTVENPCITDQHCFHRFEGWPDFAKRANCLAYLSICPNIVSNTLVLCLVWYLCFYSVVSKERMERDHSWRIAIGVCV